MKKLFLACMFLIAAGIAQSQSAKYESVMRSRVQVLDTTRSKDALLGLSAAFERIGEAEQNQWLPFYYAALAKINAGYAITGGNVGGLAEQLDPLADAAEKLIEKAEALQPDNSDIYLVRKMIATLRMMADPMNRYMQYGPMAAQALETAKRLDPENPRVYYLEGQDKFYTPEQYGGSKSEAKKLFELAIAKFDKAKPVNALVPQWGRGNVEYYLKKVQQ